MGCPLLNNLSLMQTLINPITDLKLCAKNFVSLNCQFFALNNNEAQIAFMKIKKTNKKNGCKIKILSTNLSRY